MAEAIGLHTRVKRVKDRKGLVEHGVSEELGSGCHLRGGTHGTWGSLAQGDRSTAPSHETTGPASHGTDH